MSDGKKTVNLERRNKCSQPKVWALEIIFKGFQDQSWTSQSSFSTSVSDVPHERRKDWRCTSWKMRLIWRETCSCHNIGFIFYDGLINKCARLQITCRAEDVLTWKGFVHRALCLDLNSSKAVLLNLWIIIFSVIIICYFDVAFSTIYHSFQSISHHSCIKATDLPKTEIY